MGSFLNRTGCIGIACMVLALLAFFVGVAILPELSTAKGPEIPKEWVAAAETAIAPKTTATPQPAQAQAQPTVVVPATEVAEATPTSGDTSMSELLNKLDAGGAKVKINAIVAMALLSDTVAIKDAPKYFLDYVQNGQEVQLLEYVMVLDSKGNIARRMLHVKTIATEKKEAQEGYLYFMFANPEKTVIPLERKEFDKMFGFGDK